MSSQTARSTLHTVSVDAPASVVYGMLADAPRWPLFLPSCIHVERMEFDGTEEQLWVWDVEDDRVRFSRVRRVLHPRTRSVDFEEFAGEDSSWPGAVASGTWSVAPEDGGRSALTLRYEELVPGGTPARGALEADVLGRLDGIRQMAERWDSLDELLLSFEDSTRVDGPSELVYDFLYRVEDWADLLPRVDSAHVTEDLPGVQIAALDTCSVHTGLTVTAEAVRLCFPAAGRIVYKETVTPDLIAAHTGEWSILPDESGLTVVSAHRVLLRPEAFAEVLGDDACPADARLYVREWLGRADQEALGLAKWHAESPVRRLR
ncbi:SRPBCC family protein [Streptomyces sp. NBC_01465]|uniref:SRPBCC family protein n=1 Tax=Streptomyces sp. NBC_01465 TaxID=2903878 RepID=UPI002E2FF8E7|nr:SRPBCC family protein [Streptomyces sp. NBC_01465]